MLPKFISWFYGSNLKTVIHRLKDFNLLILYYFGVGYHLKTFFSPLKRQYIRIKNHWNFAEVGSAVSFNLISRIIGAILRSILIISGFAVFICSLTFSLFTIIIYLFLSPIIFPFYLLNQDQERLSKTQKLALSHSHHLGLLLQKVLNTDEGIFIIEHLGFMPQTIINYIKTIQEKGDSATFLNLLNQKKKEHPATYGDLIQLLYQTYDPLKNLFIKWNITDQNIVEASLWYKNLYILPQNKSSPPPHHITPLGSTWGYGYTPTLDKLAEKYTDIFTLFPKVIGRDEEIGHLERILSKTTQNSAVIFGEPGVGRHAIIHGFASRKDTGMTKPDLLSKRILLFDPKSIFASQNDDLTRKKIANDIFAEAEFAGNIILVIDNIENYIQSGPGKIDFTEIFENYLSRGRLQIISITDNLNYYHHISENATLNKLFDKVEVNPPSNEIVAEELKLSIIPSLEYSQNVIISVQALHEVITLSDRFDSQHPFPEKAIDLLNEIIIFAKDKKHYIILPPDVRELLTIKTRIPVGDLENREKDLLTHLAERLHESIINQEEAIQSIAKSMRRGRTDVAVSQKPLGSFLFLGPTGVGKTETAKTLARLYFGAEDKMIRFDMSQYQDEGVSRLIGSTQSNQSGELLQKITDNPFSVLLLDEIEKADRKVQNLFLTLLDEGYIEDNTGHHLDCKNLIVIATSNAGGEFIRETVLKGQNTTPLKDAVLEFVQKNDIFSPEFLNRFDNVVVFTPLSEGHLREVTRLMLQKLNKRLEKHQISVKITGDLIRSLVAIGHDPVFGARAIGRTIADQIEDQIAQRIIKGDLKKGEEIEIKL